MSQKQALRLVIDGVFFQIGRSGIARVWQKIFEHWIRTGFSEHVVVLDRAGTLPRMPGLITMSLPGFDYAHQARDRLLLQQACDAAGATVFMSTYYTMPVYTPSLMNSANSSGSMCAPLHMPTMMFSASDSVLPFL